MFDQARASLGIYVDETAVVAEDATLMPGVVVGAHSVVSSQCVLEPYAIVGPFTSLGERCRVSSFASVGCAPQEHGTPPDVNTRLEVGHDCIFREGCTISRGSLKGDGITTIGSGCLFMAQSHVGHDAKLGNHVTLANQCSLAGHCVLCDQVIVSGHAALHQFVRVGRLAFIAAHAMVSQDIPPFTLAAGDRAKLMGLNKTGLERAGLDSSTRAELKAAFKGILLASRRLEAAQSYLKASTAEVRELAEFILAPGRGIARALREETELS